MLEFRKGKKKKESEQSRGKAVHLVCVFRFRKLNGYLKSMSSYYHVNLRKVCPCEFSRCRRWRRRAATRQDIAISYVHYLVNVDSVR